MPLEIATIPCLSDNYAYLIHASETGETALVDAPEAAAIEAALADRGWRLTHILITHHHFDHVDGVDALRVAHGAKVIGHGADAARLPKLDQAVSDGETFDFAGHEVQVMDVSGHTVGHIAFYIPDARAVFTADSLMALGCGRLFEGSADQMWASLSRIAALPPDTTVCAGHEYTMTNARFALTIEPENAALKTRANAVEDARAAGQPTVPSQLSEEHATNPFLRTHLQEVKEAIAMPSSSDVAVFAEIRKRKDNF